MIVSERLESAMKKSLLFASLLLFSLCASGAERTLVAAADPWPPFADEKTPEGGLSLEIIRAAYKTQQIDVDMRYVPWARAEAGVKQGTYDILINVWHTEARAADLFFSTPYAVNTIKFIKRKGDPFEFDGIESLEGKLLGTVRGYGYGEALVNPTRFVREDANDFVTNVRKLASRRIDLTLEDEIVARFILAKDEPRLLEQIEFTKKAFSANPLHLASDLKSPKHREIVESFNKGYEIIKANGTLERIFRKYGIGK
jgi:polar amino acid transport system substrate-binding protein